MERQEVAALERQFPQLSLQKNGRSLVRQGQLMVAGAVLGGAKPKPMSLFLFNDALLLAASSSLTPFFGKSFLTEKLRVCLFLDFTADAVVAEEPRVVALPTNFRALLCFQVRSMATSFVAQCESPTEASEWLLQLQTLLNECRLMRDARRRRRLERALYADMYFDNDNDEDEDESDDEFNSSIDAFHLSEPSKKRAETAPVWKDDSATSQCPLCANRFSIILRKHHCRRCGDVVCDKCSRNRQLLRFSSQPVRVCDRCIREPAVRKKDSDSDLKKECFRAEAGFVKLLRIIAAMQRHSRRWMRAAEWRTVFESLRPITELHTKIWNEMRIARKKGGNPFEILFKHANSFFRGYESYARTQQDRLDIVERLQSHVLFTALAQELAVPLPCTHIFMAPLFHLQKHSSICRRAQSQESTRKLADSLDTIDHKLQLAKHDAALARVYCQLAERICAQDVVLFPMHSKLVKFGRVANFVPLEVKFGSASSLQQEGMAYVYLFSDRILVTDEAHHTQGEVRLHACLQHQTLQVSSLAPPSCNSSSPGGDNCNTEIVLEAREPLQQTIRLRFANADETEQWHSRIMATVATFVSGVTERLCRAVGESNLLSLRDAFSDAEETFPPASMEQALRLALRHVDTVLDEEERIRAEAVVALLLRKGAPYSKEQLPAIVAVLRKRQCGAFALAGIQPELNWSPHIVPLDSHNNNNSNSNSNKTLRNFCTTQSQRRAVPPPPPRKLKPPPPPGARETKLNSEQSPFGTAHAMLARVLQQHSSAQRAGTA
ncbi:MAG: hypothetical protein MHM6MM_004281 [Cercozoa sp. M6MM]